MPKRIVDGEGLWRSEKLLAVAAKYRPEFANLLPLALANGSFELGASREVWARRIHSIVYSFNRPDVTPEMADEILGELYRAKLLFVWYDTSTAKWWAYWVGINKPGRLPSISRQAKKHEATGAQPPLEEFQTYLASTPETLVSQWPTIGQPMASNALVLALVLDRESPQPPAASAPIPAKPKTKKTPFPENFGISERVQKWAEEKGYSRLREHFEHFVGKAKAKGYEYADWDEALMNAIRDDWAKLGADAKVTSAKPVFNLPPKSRKRGWSIEPLCKHRIGANPARFHARLPGGIPSGACARHHRWRFLRRGQSSHRRRNDSGGAAW